MFKICIAFGQAFKDTVMEYTKNTSLSGFNLLHYISRKKYQRVFWSFFLITGIICASYVTFENVNIILERPIVTTLNSALYNIKKDPFPAVAICSVNKLSRNAVNDFVKEMRQKYNPPISHEKFLQKMKLLAGFFDSGSVDFKEAAEFQKEFLDKQKINITETFKRLAPRCEDLILKCRWANELQECKTLFSKRFTANGYCCTFNYIRTSEDKAREKLKYPAGTDVLSGLTLLLNTSRRDYFITDRSFVGFTLQIFNYGDFPDGSIGGSVQEAFIPQDSEVELQVNVILQSATSELKMYSINQRHCFLYGENVGSDDEGYSKDACMTRCKSREMMRICGCVPVYTPPDLLNTHEGNITYCTLSHLECLKQNRGTLNTYSLLTSSISTAQSNLTLNCPKCLPFCNFNSYTFRKLISSLKDTHLRWHNKQFLQLISDQQMKSEQFDFSYESLTSLIRNTEDLSIVKINLESLYAVRFSKRSLYRWYDILSIIGGVVGIFMGASLISVVEVIYFFGLKFVNNFRRIYQIKLNVQI